MTSIPNHPINGRWPAKNPNILQLYSFPTPNGVKASIMLEEIGLPYEAHKITLADADVKSPEFLSLNPNNKIPAIIDPDGPDGNSLGLFESGAILIYLADKTGKFLPKDGAKRYEVLQWLMFQKGGLGPMLGQLGYFYKFAGAQIEDQRPVERYLGEAKRLLNVLEQQLEGKDWIAGEYSIADIAIAPWLRVFDMYGVKEELEWEKHPNLIAYLARFMDRPAVRRGVNIPARD